jgi:hypothetical protein
MCSIIGSFDKRRILELNEINAKRGSFSYSIGHIDPDTNCFGIVEKDFGEPPLEKLLEREVFNNKYIVMHRQAPTNGLTRDRSRIHPAVKQDITKNLHYLYHNGIVKANDLQRLEKIHNQKFPWDTYAILTDIVRFGLDISLKDLDASFACIYIQDLKRTLLFRNSSSIIYYDNDLNISSEFFPGGIELIANNLYRIDFQNRLLDEIQTFQNIEDRYFFV